MDTTTPSLNPNSPSIQGINIRKQPFYHQSKGFEYNKFYYSIWGYTEPLIEKEGVHITTMFINEDENGRIYGNYQISDKLKRDEGFGEEANFLEEYRLYLDEETHKNTSIYQIYHNFHSLDPETEKGPLNPTLLKNYFNKKDIPNAIDINFAEKSTHYETDKEKFQLAEDILVSKLLAGYEPSSSVFLPLPIICRGYLVGIVYYIYDRSKARAINQGGINLKQYYRLLILNATREYESTQQFSKYTIYASKPEDPIEDYIDIFSDLGIHNYFNLAYINTDQRFEHPITGNPFLLKLGYQDYYTRFAWALIFENKQIGQTHKARIRSAIIAIIVDSFAHNIGAHSLVALKWWFENRARITSAKFSYKEYEGIALKAISFPREMLEEFALKREFYSWFQGSGSSYHANQLSLLDLLRFMAAEDEEKLLSFDYLPLDKSAPPATRFPPPIPSAISHFFQYLRDKSAFWSGVTRDAVFSGQVKSWEVLLREFLNNTLFLGSIAHSEGLNKVHFYLEILDEKGVVIEAGEYVEINLNIIRKERAEGIPIDIDSEENKDDRFSNYSFLRKGARYWELRKILVKLDEVFLPNGIIGQHSLYTLLENTLRNIKHYKWGLKKIRKTGIRLCVSIQEIGFWEEKSSKKTEDKKLYKVGCWLHHPQYLLNENKAYLNEDPNRVFSKIGTIIHSHTQQLHERIIDENGYARLGGSSQDKVCASMLMNNSFTSIDINNLVEVKQQYFPYVFASSEPYAPIETRSAGYQTKDTFLHKVYNPQLIAESALERKTKYKEEVIQYIKQTQDLGQTSSEKRPLGTIKKFFHIWKGEKCKILKGHLTHHNENLSRFHILVVDEYTHQGISLPFKNLRNPEKSAFYELRKSGVIRIVEYLKHYEQIEKDVIAEAENKLEAEEIKKRVANRQYMHAMEQWVGFWLGDKKKKLGIKICKPADGQKDTLGAAFLEYETEKWKIRYFNKKELRKSIAKGELTVQDINDCHSLDLAHGGELDMSYEIKNSICRVRSHGSFMQDIFANYKLDDDSIVYANDTATPLDSINIAKATFKDSASPGKLLETGLTHITIFDNRLYERLPKNQNSSPLSEQLRIRIFPEEKKIFFDQRDSFLQKAGHFLIIHLSFLESLPIKKGVQKSYREDQVKEFYQKEIIEFYENNFSKTHIPKELFEQKFHLVIASGRGRGKWFKAVEHPQITFRPIEALITAVEDGLMLKDDFQVKYNLCNILFGS